MPADSVFFFVPGEGHFLLEEAGVRIASRMQQADLGFLVGETVAEIRGDQIVFDPGAEPAPHLFVRVETQEVCVDSDGHPLALPDLIGRTVSTATTSGGTLFLVFVDGASLRCDPHAEYEAWHVERSEPFFLVISRPGGLSVWDEAPPIAYAELRERDPATAAVLDRTFKAYNLPPPIAYAPPSRGTDWYRRLLRRLTR